MTAAEGAYGSAAHTPWPMSETYPQMIRVKTPPDARSLFNVFTPHWNTIAPKPVLLDTSAFSGRTR